MTTKQTIIPHLWFDKEAKEAAQWYASIFPYAKVTNVTTISVPVGRLRHRRVRALGAAIRFD